MKMKWRHFLANVGSTRVTVLVVLFFLDLSREECACGPLSKCVNRDLYIECISGDCPSGNYCQNQRFQRLQYSPVEVMACGPKGHGLRTVKDLKR